jgi:hypothetical protein
MGQTAGSFGATCQALGCPVIGPTTSGSWGGPYVGGTLVDWNSGNGAKKWVLLGEGSYNPALLGPTLQSAMAAMVPSATMTVYSDGFYYVQMVFNTIIVFVPEPATFAMAALSLFGLLGMARCRRSFPS